MDANEFRDRSHCYGYLVACETARRLQKDTGSIEVGRRHLKAFQAGRPEDRGGYELWLNLLEADGTFTPRRPLPDGYPPWNYTPSLSAISDRLWIVALPRTVFAKVRVVC